MDRGKLVIIGIFAVALGMAAFAWWYRYQQGSRTLAFWGPPNAALIGGGKYVELLTLEGIDEGAELSTAEWLSIGDRRWLVAARTDITHARGLIHARHALLQDATYRWDERRGNCPDRWDYVARFRNAAGDDALVAFDLGCRRVRLVGGDREQAIQPDINDGLRELFERETAE